MLFVLCSWSLIWRRRHASSGRCGFTCLLFTHHAFVSILSSMRELPQRWVPIADTFEVLPVMRTRPCTCAEGAGPPAGLPAAPPAGPPAGPPARPPAAPQQAPQQPPRAPTAAPPAEGATIILTSSEVLPFLLAGAFPEIHHGLTMEGEKRACPCDHAVSHDGLDSVGQLAPAHCSLQEHRDPKPTRSRNLCMSGWG